MIERVKHHIARQLKIPVSNYLNIIERKKLKDSQQGKVIFLSALPKSGSTYVSSKLSDLWGLKTVHLSDLQGGCEFDIYRPRLIDEYENNIVVHQHTLGTPGNVEYLRRFNIPTIVLLRDIREVIVSFKDHLVNESLYWPFLAADEENFGTLSNTEKIDFVIQFALPWLLHFYISWYKVKLSKLLPIHFFFYNDLVDDEKRFFLKLAEAANLNRTQVNFGKNMESFGNMRRTNRPKDRWHDEMTMAQISDVQKYTRFYPNVDFAPIGL